MESTFPDLEQGPLSDTSFQDDDDVGAGIVNHSLDSCRKLYMSSAFTGVTSSVDVIGIMKSIYSLTAGLPDHLLTPTDDGTAADESTLLMERRRLMRLDLERLDQPGEEQRSGIVFSPGGSEAYVFTGSSAAAAAVAATAAPEGGAAGSTPREIHDPIFVEGDREFAAANQRTRELVQGAIHERLGHIKSALGGMQSEESSPRNFAAAEHEFAASTTDDGSLASPRPGGTLQHPGRATSPSVASVASSTASGLTTGRRNLEWDSGADLGYLGDLHAQEEAAATLSTLEKMAIGNYTSFLRSPDRGARGKGGAASGHPTKQDLDAMHRRLRERQQTEDDMRQERLQKFADSLMKQRNLRKMTATKPAGSATAAATGQRQKRSKSRESKRSTPDSSPSRRSERPSRRSQSKSSSALKSHSLTDLKEAATAATDGGGGGGGGATALRAYMSNSELAHAQLLPDNQARQPTTYGSAALLQRFFTGSSEPSSVSSAATVVATADAAVGGDEGHLDHLRTFGTDPESIPQHLQV